ncbi:MAG: hypothetical protein IT445_13720 [Phycisphaeraceae bacterium]|nr:hypothetical protein [Phycisphaeraceae bacterium]
MRYSVSCVGSLCLCLCLLTLSFPADAQDFSVVPGVVINYEESPAYYFDGNGTRVFTEPRVFLATPSITIMPNGDYIVSHDYFSSGTNEDTVKVFRSTDKGQTWTYQSTVMDAFWCTIFEHNGDLYLMGDRQGGSNGDILIRKSTDYGVTWTNPVDANSGFLRDGDYGGTANTPTIYDGRIWIAEHNRLMSAPVDSNLLLASSWTLSNTLTAGSGEAQVVASPQTGVVMLPVVGNQDYTYLIRATANPAVISSPPSSEHISLPGAGKKFAAQYDPVSEKFYVLDNPVLPVHEGITGSGLTRTTAAMFSSKDLVNWDMEKIFLFTPNVDGEFGEGFQYFNFAIDGDDMAVASRTAIAIPGENPPPRGHDSNLITFHVIDHFRTASPDQYLMVDTAGNQVLRFETTQHEDAPLGKFTLGTTFAGSALNQPDGVGQAANGDVYIREQGGRILRFDTLGNFIETVVSSPVAFSSQLAIQQAASGERTWQASSTGDWFDADNWYYWCRPDTNDEVANFGSAVAADTAISMNQSFTMKGLRFRSARKYSIVGTGNITLTASNGHGLLDVQQGQHTVIVPVLLNSDVDAFIADSSVLQFKKKVDLDGRKMYIRGQGRLWVYDQFIMHGGTLVLDGLKPFNVGNTSSLVLDGDLQFAPDASLSLALGESFELLNGVAYVADPFDHLILPSLPDGLSWDTSTLYVNGMVTIIPEPAAMLLVLPTTALVLSRRRSGNTFFDHIKHSHF